MCGEARGRDVSLTLCSGPEPNQGLVVLSNFAMEIATGN